MTCVAIINSDCSLSALPTLQEFKTKNFVVTEGMVALKVIADDATRQAAYSNRKNAYIIIAGEPLPADLPQDAFVLKIDLDQTDADDLPLLTV